MDVGAITRAANQGYINAEYMLGLEYDTGGRLPQNTKLAVEWYAKAAAQGHPGAQLHLGMIYQEGKGVPRNDRLAALWFSKAARQGNPEAQLNLGMKYTEGKGVPKDAALAYALFCLAAAQGDNDSAENMDRISSTLPPEQLDRGQALAAEIQAKMNTPQQRVTSANLTPPASANIAELRSWIQDIKPAAGRNRATWTENGQQKK